MIRHEAVGSYFHVQTLRSEQNLLADRIHVLRVDEPSTATGGTKRQEITLKADV
jgi:hypothetical protein